MTTINNDWITLESSYKGVIVQRKFAGLNTNIDPETNEVLNCDVYYFQRELYPNNDVIKVEKKFYTLQDLAYTEVGDQYMNPLPVLTGFIQSLGYPGIINPARDTLANQEILPADSVNGYPLRLNTREKFDKE